MNKVNFTTMANTIYEIGLPPEDSASELIWDRECKQAFEFGGWQEQDFWDEYYQRKDQDEKQYAEKVKKEITEMLS